MRSGEFFTKLVLLVFLVNGCVACEGFVYFSGQVRDTATGEPLAGVLVEAVKYGLSDTTDAAGNFEIYEFGGFSRPSPLRMSLAGYKPFEVIADQDGDYNRMRVRTETEWIEYDEPFYPDPDNRRTYLVGTSIERYSQHYALLPDSTVYYLDIDDPAAEIRERRRPTTGPSN